MSNLLGRITEVNREQVYTGWPGLLTSRAIVYTQLSMSKWKPIASPYQWLAFWCYKHCQPSAGSNELDGVHSLNPHLETTSWAPDTPEEQRNTDPVQCRMLPNLPVSLCLLWSYLSHKTNPNFFFLKGEASIAKRRWEGESKNSEIRSTEDAWGKTQLQLGVNIIFGIWIKSTLKQRNVKF